MAAPSPPVFGWMKLTETASWSDDQVNYDGPDVTLQPGERACLSTGLSSKFPENYVLRVGTSHVAGLTAFNGVIDSSYDREVKIMMLNQSAEPVTVEHGQTLAYIFCSALQTWNGGNAGFDVVHLGEPVTVPARGAVTIQVPPMLDGSYESRSGMFFQNGVYIQPCYACEGKIQVFNTSAEDYEIRTGDRYCQYLDYEEDHEGELSELVPVEIMSRCATGRGAGFGSSGR